MRLFFMLMFFFDFFSNGRLLGQTNKYVLSPKDFAEKINKIPNAPLIDVRTAAEFETGHLLYARNIDWTAKNFKSRINLLQKDSPVFVYCLSGKRSHAAAESMRKAGFKDVYEMDGGLLKWREANLPEESASQAGMTLEEFENLLVADKLVLVDFYADWCEPCKRMAPYLSKLKLELADSVSIINISADNNQHLDKALGITSLPTFLLYKNKHLVWRHVGFMEQVDLINQIQPYYKK